MFKKIIKLIIAILVLGIIASVAYWFFNKKDGEEFTPQNFIKTFFPSAGNREGGETPIAGDQPGTITLYQGKLVRLASSVSGASWSSTTAMYIERTSGHIYKIGQNGQNKIRVSNSTILKTFESSWPNNSDNLAIKYFTDEDMDSEYDLSQKMKIYLASLQIPSATSSVQQEEGKIEGTFLPSSAVSAVLSPDGQKVFYMMAEDGNGVSQGVIADYKNSKPKAVLNLYFDEFQISWPVKNLISFVTKPSADIEGNLYFFDTDKNKFRKILGALNGLQALVSPNGDKVFYSYNDRGINTKIYNITDKTEAGFGLETLPEKCVWGKKDIIYCGVPETAPVGNYLDSWYQGEISFNDAIWKVNLETGEINKLTQGLNMDAINLFLDSNEDCLFFINKKDNSFWSLNLDN